MVVFGVQILILRGWEGLVNFYHKLIDVVASGKVRKHTCNAQESDSAVKCVFMYMFI